MSKLKEPKLYIDKEGMLACKSTSRMVRIDIEKSYYYLSFLKLFYNMKSKNFRGTQEMFNLWIYKDFKSRVEGFRSFLKREVRGLSDDT